MSGFQWSDLIVALGLVLVIEGLIYAVFPGGVRRLAMELPNLPDTILRTFGIVVLVAGVCVVWIMRGLGQ